MSVSLSRLQDSPFSIFPPSVRRAVLRMDDVVKAAPSERVRPGSPAAPREPDHLSDLYQTLLLHASILYFHFIAL